MGKRNSKSKRSFGSLPKGLIRSSGGGSRKFNDVNPFEITARQKRPKHQVHNRPISKPKTTQHALESLQRRQSQLRSTIQSSKVVNSFVDRRIGQYNPSMSRDDQMIARLVKERTRQSKKSTKFNLNDDADDDYGNSRSDLGMLTHKGKKLDPLNSEALYSDDEDDDGGNLEAVDTELHFGGSGMKRSNNSREINPYGPQSGDRGEDLADVYGRQRKTELDDLIARRKLIKAERMARKESQVETFERMDEQFSELSQLLRYRKNEPPIPLSDRPAPTEEDKEMQEWNLSVKQMMMKPKRQATDRTKTPEEIAKEEAERLHKLETRRLARMNGDFDDDDFSDVSVSGSSKKGNTSKQRQKNTSSNNNGSLRNPDELSDSEDDDDNDNDKLEMRFTADGIRYFDKDGNMVEKEDKHDDDDGSDNDTDDENEDKDADELSPLQEGARIRGHYRIDEQYNGQGEWYDGVIANVHKQNDGSFTYDIEYDDGDFEENVKRKNIHVIHKQSTDDDTNENGQSDSQKKKQSHLDDKAELQMKQKLAKEKARNEMPFVFDAPTTLDALEDLIIKYASTGSDANTIIERIQASNSVRLDHRNGQKMQNFYDVLLRRFMELGDNVYLSGGGGDVIDRFSQLDCITKVLYKMAQESPEIAGAVWNRRIGILHNAHEKRLRDSVFDHETDDDGHAWTPWPSMGVFLLFRLAGNIFPVTDKRHHVVTPMLLLMAQMVSQTPVTTEFDLTMGVLLSALLVEYTKEAKRVVPEALGFVASTIRLFAPEIGKFTNPALHVACEDDFCVSLRSRLIESRSDIDSEIPRLKLERDFILSPDSKFPVAILSTCLGLVEKCAATLQKASSVPCAAEVLYEGSAAILALRPKAMPVILRKKIASTVSAISQVCPSTRLPLSRRSRQSVKETGIKSLAPRMEDPARYSMSRDKGKKSVQAAIDRTRREYKREHKAISRELRMDGAFIEDERRAEKSARDNKARAKRQKNFAWLESEQASMNQQVRQGGGLLKGGGMGLAKAKAATGRMGIKKGGKF